MSPAFRPSSALFGLLFAIVFVSCSSFARAVLRASVSTSQNVCISVTVYGPDGGDPGVGCTVVTQAPPDSSSSESSTSSSTQSSTSSSSSSSSSSVVENNGSTTGSGPTSGAHRYSVPESRWHIVRLIQQWTSRNTLHAAPHSSSASSVSSSSSAASAGRWYDSAVQLLLRRKIIDASDDLRLDADATRAEVAKLVTSLSGAKMSMPVLPSFDDAIKGAWYEPFIERAAQKTWMIGYNNCFGTRPCYFRPAAIITRAEAVAVLVRVFQLHVSNRAPVFNDVPSYAWYREAIQAAADACIVQGNDGSVRPDDSITRAELFVMFSRALNPQAYGSGCSMVMHSSASSSVQSSASVVSPVSTDDFCAASVPMCIIDALRSDIVTLVSSPFDASMFTNDVAAVVRMPPSEWIMWMALIVLPTYGIWLLARIGKPSEMYKR